MSDKKLAAQAYCATAKRLEEAQVVFKDARNRMDTIYAELEELRKQMGEGLKNGESIVILLPKKVAVVVTHHSPYSEVEICRMYDNGN